MHTHTHSLVALLAAPELCRVLEAPPLLLCSAAAGARLVGAEQLQLPPLSAVVTDFVQVATYLAAFSAALPRLPAYIMSCIVLDSPKPPTLITVQEHLDPEHDPVEGMLGMVRCARWVASRLQPGSAARHSVYVAPQQAAATPPALRTGPLHLRCL